VLYVTFTIGLKAKIISDDYEGTQLFIAGSLVFHIDNIARYLFIEPKTTYIWYNKEKNLNKGGCFNLRLPLV